MISLNPTELTRDELDFYVEHFELREQELHSGTLIHAFVRETLIALQAERGRRAAAKEVTP